MSIPVSSIEQFTVVQRLLRSMSIVYGATYNRWLFIQKGHAPVW